MANVDWIPEPPEGAAELEQEIEAAIPGVQARVQCAGDEWRVRALAPSAGCGRGRSLSDRDVSGRVAELLSDAGHPTRA